MHILVIEDEAKTAASLKQGLEENGYAVDIAENGNKGLALFNKSKYPFVISDLIMPGLNGLELCKQIRQQQPNTLILLLTALDSKEDVVTGLDAGADDYITKPFDFRELLARIRALSKRIEPGPANNQQITFADVSMNLKTKQVTRSGKAIELTAKEFKLLEYFMLRPNVVIPRSELAQNIWNISFETGTNMVEVYINYLRNKIDKPFGTKLIHNIHGVGYVLKQT